MDLNQITIGNGSNDLIEFVSRCFWGKEKSNLFTTWFCHLPISYKSNWSSSSKIESKNWGHDLELMSDLIDDKTKVIFIASPNNPTGTAKTLQEINIFWIIYLMIS